MGLVTTDVAAAADVLAAGRLCAIPTETVYGLAANADDPAAVRAVFEAKGRPADHPLIVHVAEVRDIGRWIINMPEWGNRLLAAHAPGPLTVVGRRTAGVLDEVTGGQDTVAVRVPAHPMAHALLAQLRARGVFGVVAPSANTFGRVSPTRAEHVVADLGPYLTAHQGLVLDGGACPIGIESTIVLVTGSQPVVLRPGGVTEKMISEATGLPLGSAPATPRVPGTLEAHYAPQARVVLVPDVADIPVGAGLIAYAETATPLGVVRLASPANADDYARVLYQALREGDRLGLSEIHAIIPDEGGIADAVRDRLKRAASSMGA